MHQRTCIFVVVLSFLFLLTDDAQAWRWRSRGNRGYASSGSLQVAPKVDDESSEYEALRVYYSYEKATAPEVAFPDKIRLFLRIMDDGVLKAAEPIVAEVKLTDLSDSRKRAAKFCPVSLDRTSDADCTLGTIEVGNDAGETILGPAKVYRLFVNLHRKSDQYGKESALGYVRGPYYIATSGASHLEQARQQIAMRTFKEWYYTERGWRSTERYPMDCHAFYLWATGSHTVGASHGRSNLGRLFAGRTPYRNGGEIDDLMKQGPIHGDYVRIPGHTFMLLALDAATNRVWTMEANFNRSIEVAIRSVNSGWTVGHLAEEHIRPELFAVNASRAGTQSPQPLALGNNAAERPLIP
jgi:hypothetical protein